MESWVPAYSQKLTFSVLICTKYDLLFLLSLALQGNCVLNPLLIGFLINESIIVTCRIYFRGQNKELLSLRLLPFHGGGVSFSLLCLRQGSLTLPSRYSTWVLSFQRKFEDPESIEGKLICNISTMLQADCIEIDMLRFSVAC